MAVDTYRKYILLGLIVASLALYVPVLAAASVTTFALAKFIGLIGVQLIWWQVVLGNRQITRYLTRDLVWVNKLHQLLGKYGFLFILLHPVLMISVYGLELVVPSLDLESRFDQGTAVGRLAFGLLATVWLASALLRGRLGWRWWKRLHLLAYAVLPLLFVHVALLGSSMLRYDWLQVWVYFLMVSFALMVLLRLMDWAGFTKLPYEVVRTSRAAKGVTRFQLRPLGPAIRPRPGQFAYFQIKRFRQPHPFTISHFDEASGEISHSIKAVGPYTTELTTLKPGDTVLLDGPYGVFTREIEQKVRPVVAIAGGIGITPFVRWLEAKQIDYLFLGCQTEADIAYKKTITASGAKVRYALAREDKPGYLHGHITADLIAQTVKGDPASYDFYICGPPPMMRVLQAQLIAKGVNKSQIRTEKFSL